MGQPLEVLVGVSLGLLLEDLVPGIPRIDRQKVRLELKHVCSHLIMLGCGFREGLQGYLEISLGLGA